MTSQLTEQQLNALKPLAAVIETAIQDTPIRLGSDDWGTALGARLLADIAAYMGRTLGPDAAVLAEIQAERERQDAKWGEQNHPDGTGDRRWADAANVVRGEVNDAARFGRTNWNGVLREEVFEALAESDPAKLRAELIQVAAVAVAWIEAIDRRASAVPAT